MGLINNFSKNIELFLLKVARHILNRHYQNRDTTTGDITLDDLIYILNTLRRDEPQLGDSPVVIHNAREAKSGVVYLYKVYNLLDAVMLTDKLASEYINANQVEFDKLTDPVNYKK